MKAKFDMPSEFVPGTTRWFDNPKRSSTVVSAVPDWTSYLRGRVNFDLLIMECTASGAINFEDIKYSITVWELP